MYLRCFCQPKKWLSLLSWAELWYNTNYHSSIKTTPFNVLYGRDLPGIIHYNPGDSSIDTVDSNMQVREEALKHIKTNLKKCRELMKLKADTKRKDIEFKVGDWIWVK